MCDDACYTTKYHAFWGAISKIPIYGLVWLFPKYLFTQSWYESGCMPHSKYSNNKISTVGVGGGCGGGWKRPWLCNLTEAQFSGGMWERGEFSGGSCGFGYRGSADGMPFLLWLGSGGGGNIVLGASSHLTVFLVGHFVLAVHFVPVVQSILCSIDSIVFIA